MHKFLREICEIRSGYTMRQSIDQYVSGEIKVIHAKHLADINGLTLPTINKLSSDHYLVDGDILLSAKGSFVAIVFNKSIGKAVATSSIMILRPKNNSISPEYVVTYLNSAVGQSSLKQISSGAYIKTLTKSELENLEIPIPSLDIQEIIVKLSKNISNQKIISNKKGEAQQRLLNSILNEVNKEKK